MNVVIGEGEIVLSPDVKEKNPLEGAILVHGFIGNYVSMSSLPKPEWKTVPQVVERGAIVTPSKRTNLTPEEIDRHELVAPFDKNRLCFYALKGQGAEDVHAYVGNSCFVCPVTSLEGLIVTNDPAGGNYEVIAACSQDGIEIPLTKGVIFLTEYLYRDTEKSLREYAERINIPWEIFIKQHVRILPPDIFSNSKLLFQEAEKIIKPSHGVNMKPMQIGDTRDWVGGNPAKLEDLGDGKLITS